MAHPRVRRFVLLAGGLVVFVAFYLARLAFLVEPDSLTVVEYNVEIPSWPQALDGFRIAAVGDLHGGAPLVDEAKLNEVARRTTEARPDLIVWLGDYVIQGVRGGRFIEPEVIARILSAARARYGQVAIIGNHDRWLDAQRVENAFTSAGVPFLRWSSRVIVVNDIRLHLYGLDDFELSPGFWSTLNKAAKDWDALPASDPLILLSHNPDVFPWLPRRAALTLAAHTHGGQVRFPLIGSPIVPSSFGQRYARGLIVEDNRYLFVNTGIGTSILPVRFGVRPEISIVTLKHGGSTAAPP